MCRQEGSFQLSEGWKAFAQCWGLGHGEQLQLSRRFLSSGCVWLDVKIVVSTGVSAHSGGMLSSPDTFTRHVNLGMYRLFQATPGLARIHCLIGI